MRKIILLAVLVAGACMQGCVAPVRMDGTVPASRMPQESITESGAAVPGGVGAYRLRPLDPVYIRFSGIQEQQALELVIDENGEIGLLHIPEPVKAAGLTTSDLEEEIERRYIEGQIYKNVSVNVTMTAKVYYMQGEVNAPGQYELASGTTLLQAIAGARGPTAFANMKKVTVNRHGKVYTFNVKKLEKDPSMDIKIEAGDVIKIWQKWY